MPAGIPTGMVPEGLDDLAMMAPSPEEQIAAWIERAFTHGPVDRIALRSKNIDGESAIYEWDVAEELRDLEPAAVAAEIISRAEEDASGAGAPSRFVVCAYRPGKPDAYFSRTFFRLTPPDLDSAFDTEPPTAAGLTAQAHRHLESVMRLHIGGSADVLRTLRRENERLAATNDAYGETFLKVLSLQQQLMDRQAERDIHVAKAQRNLLAQNQVIGKAMSYGESFLLQKYPALAALAPPRAGLAAAAGGATVDLAPDEVSQADRICLAVAADLAALEESVWAMALAQLPADARGPMRRARQVIVEARAEDRSTLTAEEGAVVMMTRGHVINLMAALDDQKFGLLLAQTSEPHREPLSKFRALIRARAAQGAPSPPPPAAAATPQQLTPGATT